MEITDGTSNTLLVTEQAGRPELYIRGQVQAPPAVPSQVNNWGCWASYQVFQVQQFGSDGITKDGPGGPCTINCNNSQGVYAFHQGGANAVFADGSVCFPFRISVPCQFVWNRDHQWWGDSHRGRILKGGASCNVVNMHCEF